MAMRVGIISLDPSAKLLLFEIQRHAAGIQGNGGCVEFPRAGMGPLIPYSARRACTGSMRVARMAGSRLASPPVRSSTAAAMAAMPMLNPPTPKSNPLMARAARAAKAMPAMVPSEHGRYAVLEDELIDLRGLRAERDADAELARALQCGVGDDAVDAERGEDERAGGEGEQQMKLEVARGE